MVIKGERERESQKRGAKLVRLYALGSLQHLQCHLKGERESQKRGAKLVRLYALGSLQHLQCHLKGARESKARSKAGEIISVG